MAGKINKASPSYIRRKEDADKAFQGVRDKLQQVLSGISEVSKESLDEIALTIKNKSDTYAPLDTGELIASSYIASEETKDNYTVEIGYTADHAVYTHEIGPYQSPTTPGTNFKYLQRAATDTESEVPTIVADSIKGILP